MRRASFCRTGGFLFSGLLGFLLLSSCQSGTFSSALPVIPNVEVIGEPGRGVGKLFQPRAIVTRNDGGCIIIDRSGRAQVFDDDHQVIRVWTLPEWSSGHPIDLCMTAEGTLLVADTHYMRVIEFTEDGEEIRRFGREAGLELVRGIDVGPDGTIYVASYGEHDRIFRFTREGALIDFWGQRGDGFADFLRPEGLAVAPDGTLWVIDCGHQRLLRFTPDGTWIQTIESTGLPSGQLSTPFDVDVLDDGTLFVVDRSGCRLNLFSSTGESLHSFGGIGRQPGRLHEPRGVAVTLSGDLLKIYIADTGNHRISHSVLDWKEMR